MTQQNTYGYLKTFSALDANEQVSRDYRQAQMRALWNWLLAGFRRGQELADFSQATSGARIASRHEIGFRQVPLERVRGSVGRSGDFDRTFMPLQKHTRGRWLQVDRAFREGEPLSPVELYQVGEDYYVVDGHHRLSVAALHGQRYVEARVTRVELGRKAPDAGVGMTAANGLRFAACHA